MNYFPFTDLPIELQELVVSKMNTLTWMNYQLAYNKTISIYITKKEWDNANSDISSDTCSYISQESYDMDNEFSSDSCIDT